MLRTIKNVVTGFRTQDGAGVKLVRVLGHDTVEAYNPFLMLDSFDSTNPEDYIKGFPMHPHRGIETITFLSQGSITHQDSLGNRDTINAGEVQWMTAGSGIMHEEMPQPAERMLGVQVWLNLAREDKMTKPEYHSIRADEILEIKEDGGKVRLLSGDYKHYQGFQGNHIPINFYDIQLEAHQSLILDDEHDIAFVFLLEGDAIINGRKIDEKSSVLLVDGNHVEIETIDHDSEILYLSADALRESVAWGGPIVMNTQAELDLAFSELQVGTFIKENPEDYTK